MSDDPRIPEPTGEKPVKGPKFKPFVVVTFHKPSVKVPFENTKGYKWTNSR